ncbi:MAG TPA: hypothetical protein VIG48_06170 [Jatrophihabitans sp.]|jgi:membrane protein
MEPVHPGDDAHPRRGVLRRVLNNPLAVYIRETREQDLGVHLLAISAQQLLCTAPLAVALGAVGKRLTGVSFAGVLTYLLDLTPQAEHEIDAALAGSPNVSLSALLLNLVFSIAFGVGLAATLQRGMELMWHLPRGTYVSSTVRQVLWAIALPLMIAAVVATGRLGHEIGRTLSAAVEMSLALQIITIAVFIWWTQYHLLGGRVAMRKVALPTSISTLAIAIVVLAGRQLVSGQIVPAYRAYGSVGIGIVLSAWVAIASSASSIGLAVGSWLQQRRDSHAMAAALRIAPEAAIAEAAS